MKNLFYLTALAIMLLCSCQPDDSGDLDHNTNVDTGTSDDNNTNTVKFPVAKIVDLGLSVHWASWNIGESSEFMTGVLYVWGDVDGNKPSGVSLDECPSEFPPKNISGTEYDIATKQWGNDWRLPLNKEFIELWSNSTVAIGEIKGTPYYKFTSNINGNSIYLPAHDDYLYASCYWTGDLCNTDTRCAISRYIDTSVSQPSNSYINMERNNKCCIRPVYEHTKVWTNDAKDIKAYSCTIEGSLSYIATNKSRNVGFYLSTARADIENLSENVEMIQALRNESKISAEISGLIRNKEYYYRAFVEIDGKEYLGEIKQFKTPNAYEVGELWPNKENPEGIVFHTGSDGIHGSIVSLDQTSLVWQGGIATFVAANDYDDGRNNTLPSNSLIAQWVAGHGSEWYCPAKNELLRLSGAVKKVNATLRQIGLSPLENIYWTSTQYSVNYYDLVYMVVITENASYMGYANSYCTYNSKSNTRGVVAIRRF